MQRRINMVARQRGAVLIMALLLLVVMTLLGLSAMRGAVMEERMAGNAHDHNMAFQAAESGLRDAADWLLGLAARPTPDASASGGVYLLGSIGNGAADYSFDWVGAGTEYGANTAQGGGDFPRQAALPRYVVEESAFVPDSLDPDAAAQGQGRYYYTVSSIGYGGSSAAESVVQSVFEKRYN
jgi:type IV pilus assembly protein PilX